MIIFTGDSTLLKILESTFTGNSLLIEEKVSALAGTCDCVSNNKLGYGLSNMEEFGLDLEI